MKFVVGLTGGIGSGKSVAANRFAQLGVSTVDTDQIARDVVNVNSPALKQISNHFGSHILLADESLDRKALRKIIFEDAVQKKWLENLLHPIIRETIIQQLSNAPGDYAILISPLLLETDQHQLVDRILVIDAEKELQIKRATERDKCSPEQIKKIINSQLSRSDRLARAHDIIYNHADLNDLHTQVNQLHETYLKLAHQKNKLPSVKK